LQENDVDGLGWVATIIVGGFAGWIASMIVRVRNNIFINIILGIVGAVVLNYVLSEVLHANPVPGIVGQLITAIIGAVIIMVAYRAISGRNV
jgi:uncharacterized membrane protein YeaQ/YmgE (transglycosylase-associated protein family)